MADTGSYQYSCNKNVSTESKPKRKHIDEQGESSKTINTAIPAVNRNEALDTTTEQLSFDKSATKELKRKRKHIDEQGESSKTIKTAISAVDRNQVVDTTTERQLNKKEYSARMNRNLAELKDALLGTPYELKLAIAISLANAKKTLDPRNKLSIKVSAENPELGNFKNIIYEFNDEGKTGRLKIQIKHELRSPLPRIKLHDVTTTEDLKNPFAILKYFTSFYDQPTQSASTEGIIICTNTDIDDTTRELWKPVDPDFMDDSTTSLNSCVYSLFNKVAGKCYRLDFDTLTDGSFNELYQRCRENSKCTRLAKLLVMAIKLKSHKLTRQNPLVREYHGAILSIIDMNDSSATGSYKFTEEFLNCSLTNVAPGYDDFRLEFEEEYSEVENVWKVLEDKRIHVAKDFLLAYLVESEENELALIFPEDDVDKRLMEFCQKVRLMCYNNNEHELDATIGEFWKNIYSVDDSGVNHQKGKLQEDIISAKVTTNFNWLMDVFFKPVNSENIEQELRRLNEALTVIKMKSASDQLHSEITKTPFRIRHDVLKCTELFCQITDENYRSFHHLYAYDIYFGAAVLSEIISLQEIEPYDIFFMNSSDFITDSKKVETIYRSASASYYIYFIIICYENSRESQTIVRECARDFLKKSSNQVFIITKTSSASNYSDFRNIFVKDLTEESWEQFRNQVISLCSTTISPVKLFENNFKDLSIEDLCELLEGGKQMEQNNDISNKYREIEKTYIHRPWIDAKIRHTEQNIPRNEISTIIQYIKEAQRENISFKEITESAKKDPNFDRMFENANYPEEEHESIIGDQGKKLLILLGEAGVGKSTNLTSLAWHLRTNNPSFWVVRINLIDHCSDFKRLTDSNIERKLIVDETEAIRMLYKMVCSLLQREVHCFKDDRCSKCLVLSDGSIILNKDLMKQHGLSLKYVVRLLVFKAKFNAREFVLLMDGFDEIAPHYKEVVLKILSLFEQFKGVMRLYVTSRPYGFKEQFKQSFDDPLFFQLKPLTLQQKGSLLYRMMRHNGNNENEELSDFYKCLCFLLLYHLGDMSDVLLNLMMIADILKRSYDRYLDFSRQTIDAKLFQQIEEMCKESFIVENNIEMRVRLVFGKFGVQENACDNPILMDKQKQKIEQVKPKHGLVALRNFFSTSELNDILSEGEMQESQDYMKKIHEAHEKTGIINGIQEGVPMFIHRSFAEYLAACWVVRSHTEPEQQDRIRICSLESFWDEERRNLREHIDRILANRYPLHLSIIDRDWATVETLISTSPMSLYETDDGNRTPLHLMAFYFHFEDGLLHFLQSVVDPNTINEREKVFGWTALDIAFKVNVPEFICYLLDHGAAINVDVLLEQVVPAGNGIVRRAAIYVKHVTAYQNCREIACESHDACKKMEEFCDKMILYLINLLGTEFSANLRRIFDFDCFIREGVNEILKSVIQVETDDPHFFQMIRNSYLK